MKQENIKIFGTQELKKFKYNPNKATFFVKTSSGIDWFDMKIEVVFGDQTVSLKEIQKAVLKKQNYVELKDGTLGILPEEWLMKYEHIFKLGKIKGENVQVSKLHFSLLDELGADIDNFAVDGNKISTVTLTSASPISYVAFYISIDGSGGSTSTDINSISYSNVDPLS